MKDVNTNPMMSHQLLDQLRQRPYEFEFFQAVRLLHSFAERAVASKETLRPIGWDFAPGDEVARFRVVSSFAFPASEIASFVDGEILDRDGRPAHLPPVLTVAFAGLVGPQGVLPRHYTQMVIDGVRQKDLGFRDFLDIFHHRLISLFYRVWEKYHFPIAFEHTRLRPDSSEDLFTHGLHCLVGLGPRASRHRLRLPDMALLHYGGIFAQRPPNAVSLERLVAEYFDVETELQQFQGQWLYLDAEDQTQLCLGQQPLGRNTQLGVTALVGERVWNVENRFVLRLGPLNYTQFERLTPVGTLRGAFDDLVRMYVGMEYDVDTQLVLRHDEVPCVQLGGSSEIPARLGWNTWIYNQRPRQHADDALFQVVGVTA